MIELLKFLTDVAIVLLGILLFFLAGLHLWATSYLARRDIEAAIRNAKKRGKHQPPIV